MEKAGGLSVLRPSGGVGRLFGGAANEVVRYVRRAFVGGNRVLGFAFSHHCPIDLAAGAAVLYHNLRGSPGKNLGAFGLAVYFGRLGVGTLGTGHRGSRGSGGGGGSFPLVEHLANFRGSGDAVVAHWFVLGVGRAGESEN